MKAFLIDVTKCVGCYDCQIGCKDEHCGQAWAPYTVEQPEIGQFWIKVNQYERGARPHVKVSYVPVLCQHCEDCAAMKVAENDAMYRREDGLTIIDPAKAKGQRQLVDACPYGAIFYNEELDVPQKCTGCAHLLDGGHPITTPRCVDNCHLDVIQFGEEEELDLDGTEVLHPEYGTHPRVFYRGLPKKFVAGTVYDPEAEEIIEGAVCTLTAGDESHVATTNEWGDFWLRELPEADWTLTIEYEGKKKVLEVSTVEKDQGLGDIALA